MNFYEFHRIVSEMTEAEPSSNQDERQRMLAAINKAIDEWEKETKENLMNSAQEAPKRGILDRIGGAVQNMWYGRQNQNNPQYYRNQFGDGLGVKEDFDPILSEIRSFVEEAEKAVVEAFLSEWSTSGTMGKKFRQTQNSQSRMGMGGTMGNQAQKTAKAQQATGQPAQQAANRPAPNLKIFNIITASANNLRKKIQNLLVPPADSSAT